MKRILFIFLQCTWGIVQTLIGAVFFIRMIRCPHRMYHGSIDTQWDMRSGLSLGLFIFTPNDSIPDAEKIRVHEYGHCVQSMVLGPLQLIVGIISIVWAQLPYLVKLRKEKKIPYTACFVEAWARVYLKSPQHCSILLKIASAALLTLAIHQVLLRIRALHPLLFSEFSSTFDFSDTP